MDAENERAVVHRLRDMGYHPIKVTETAERKKTFLTKPLGRVRQNDVTLMFQQLSRLIRAGLPLMRSLRTLRKQAENPQMREVLDQLYSNVQQGRTFAESLSEHPKIFPEMYASMVAAGETGGMLEGVLERLARFSEKEQQLKGKVISALIYPCFLIFAGLSAAFILLSFVFPKFIELFDEFDAELPAPTKLLIAMCEFMESYWLLILVAIVVFAVSLFRYRKTSAGRLIFDRNMLRVPLIGVLILRAQIANFARTLGTLVDNGVPILKALRVTEATLTNRAIGAQIDVIHAAVTDGASLHESLERAEHFPPMAISMMAVGEESGMLGDVARQIADTYDEEVDRAIKNITTMLEPALILVMGVFVGFLVISMLLPMFQLSTMLR
jgi:type II secretory pathway component PulF